MVSGYGLLFNNASSRCRCGSAQPLDCIIFSSHIYIVQCGIDACPQVLVVLIGPHRVARWEHRRWQCQQRCFPVAAASPAIATTSSGRTVPMGIRLSYRPTQLFFYDRSLSLFLVVSLPSLFSRFLCDGVLPICLHSVTSCCVCALYPVVCLRKS